MQKHCFSFVKTSDRIVHKHSGKISLKYQCNKNIVQSCRKLCYGSWTDHYAQLFSTAIRISPLFQSG